MGPCRRSALAAALRVSRMTLRQALDGLARRGALARLPRRSGGAFVAEPKIDCDLTGLAGFTEQHSVAGLPVEFARDVYRADRVRLMVRTEVRSHRSRPGRSGPG
jgi:hypothetical protein